MQRYKQLPSVCDVTVVSVEHALTQNEPYKELYVHPSQEEAARKVVEEVNARYWPQGGPDRGGMLHVVSDASLNTREWYVAQYVGSTG